MTYQELLASVDRVRFRTACATLMDEELARELAEAVRGLQLPPAQRMELLLRLFADLPVYGVLCSARDLLCELPRAQCDDFFAALERALSRERSAGADAVETLLFADLFNAPSVVDVVWRTLTRQGVADPVLRSALRVSAQVPWRLKRELCARLWHFGQWHASLFHALQAARRPLFGTTVDPEEALLLLDRLELPGREAEVDLLRQQLRRER
jgi:hypothetical protein